MGSAVPGGFQREEALPGAALLGQAERLAPGPPQPAGMGSSFEHWDKHFLCLPRRSQQLCKEGAKTVPISQMRKRR